MTAGSTEPGQHTGPEQTRSLGEILGEVTSDLSELFKQEVQLAKVELKQEATKAGKGAGMLAGAGLAAVLLLVFLSLTGVYLLDNVTPDELAALVVTAVWGVVAAVLALLGRKNLRNANPQLPTTQQTLKEDAQWARAQRS
ncbi:phage holin family protein [Nocardioides litoris]|uniref:phage holin family protein n=1 Tax=Nocardioides litoris TaxID=1926648 RepID=UPI00111F3603|nr:phage holin family protein [Nocardioides litoris]